MNPFIAYAFGSAVLSGSDWADIDVLLVVNSHSDSDHIYRALEPIAATVPLHTTIVLQEEFEELGVQAWGELHKLGEY